MTSSQIFQYEKKGFGVLRYGKSKLLKAKIFFEESENVTLVSLERS